MFFSLVKIVKEQNKYTLKLLEQNISKINSLCKNTISSGDFKEINELMENDEVLEKYEDYSFRSLGGRLKSIASTKYFIPYLASILLFVYLFEELTDKLAICGVIVFSFIYLILFSKDVVDIILPLLKEEENKYLNENLFPYKYIKGIIETIQECANNSLLIINEIILEGYPYILDRYFHPFLGEHTEIVANKYLLNEYSSFTKSLIDFNDLSKIGVKHCLNDYYSLKGNTLQKYELQLEPIKLSFVDEYSENILRIIFRRISITPLIQELYLDINNEEKRQTTMIDIFLNKYRCRFNVLSYLSSYPENDILCSSIIIVEETFKKLQNDNISINKKMEKLISFKNYIYESLKMVNNNFFKENRWDELLGKVLSNMSNIANDKQRYFTRLKSSLYRKFILNKNERNIFDKNICNTYMRTILYYKIVQKIIELEVGVMGILKILGRELERIKKEKSNIIPL